MTFLVLTVKSLWFMRPKTQSYAPTVFGFFVESIELMVINMLANNEISPTLKEILCHVDEDNQQSAQAFNICQNSDHNTGAFDDNEVGLDISSRYNPTTIDHHDDINVSHEDVIFGETFQGHQEVFSIAIC